MIQQRFVEMLSAHPDILGSKKRFSGLLKDYFPQEPAIVKLILSLYDMGVHSEIENSARVTNDVAHRFVKRLVDEHGTDNLRAKNAVALFCVCYGRDILKKPCDLEIDIGDKQSEQGETALQCDAVIAGLCKSCLSKEVDSKSGSVEDNIRLSFKSMKKNDFRGGGAYLIMLGPLMTLRSKGGCQRCINILSNISNQLKRLSPEADSLPDVDQLLKLLGEF